MGLTRARVYQLLNEINDIMIVRWPLGRHQVHELREKFHSETAEAERGAGCQPALDAAGSAESDGAADLRQFDAAVELFYPGSRRGAFRPHRAGLRTGGGGRAGRRAARSVVARHVLRRVGRLPAAVRAVGGKISQGNDRRSLGGIGSGRFRATSAGHGSDQSPEAAGQTGPVATDARGRWRTRRPAARHGPPPSGPNHGPRPQRQKSRSASQPRRSVGRWADCRHIPPQHRPALARNGSRPAGAPVPRRYPSAYRSHEARSRLPLRGSICTGGNEWEPLTKGLPQSDCYVNVLRDAMAVDSLDQCGVYFGTTGGQVYASADGGDSWAPVVRDLPAVLSVEVQTLP